MNLLVVTRFMLVGMAGTLVDFALFAILHTQVGMPTLLANTLSYSAGILNNYALHRCWTFAHRPARGTGRQFSQFVGVSLSALLINNLIVLLVTASFGERLAESAIGVYFAKACAIGVGMVWNFLANHLWTFRADPAAIPQTR